MCKANLFESKEKNDFELLEEISFVLSDEECFLKIMINDIENECVESGALRVIKRDIENLKNAIIKYLYVESKEEE